MPTSDWAPPVRSVATLLRARTRDTLGNEVGTFNEDTRPTHDQVAELIIIACDEVWTGVRCKFGEWLWDSAMSVAAYRAAMLVEMSYFPEQVATGRSVYEALRDTYTAALKSLSDRACAGPPPDGPAEGSGGLQGPSYAFPSCSTLDAVLGPLPGTYVPPYSGGLYQ